MRFTLDTNVLIYALDQDAGEKHLVALDLVQRAGRRDCVMILQVLAELFRALTARLSVAPEDARAIVQDWRDAFPVHAADDRCLADAMDAVTSHGLAFWDAMIWATAKYAGCRLLISEDGHDGRTLGGVTTVNPFIAEPSPLLTEALDR